jgi:hypothetical protein
MARMSCININFDSIGWNLSLEPNDFNDPSFFSIADRFFQFSLKYHFKYTIFVIGKDLENPEVAARVRDWSQQGHEIGNHSYNHKQNLGFLDPEEIESEVMRSHDLIAETCGDEPKGFIAPAWATSRELVTVLLKNDYLYDTSLFPSYFMWLASAKVYWKFRKDERGATVLQRKDRWANLLGGRKPFFTEGSLIADKRTGAQRLLIIPLPVTPLLRIPCWHTMAFLLPETWFESVLKNTLKSCYFYYLMHPADLADLSDIPENYHDDIRVLERIEVPISKKVPAVEKYFDQIKSNSLEIVTLKAMAENIIASDTVVSK